LKLQSFDKNQVFTYKLNTAYNADAECPIWEKFVLEILNREDIPLLQEWMGYCLLPTMPKNKMMWFYGTGRNGKGRVIATLEAIFGLENCAALELSEFDGEHRFALPQLYGKMINVSSEPTTQKELQTALLKKITGEDTLDAEVKNKQRRLKFKNTAKPIVLGNKFPKVPDTTVAFWDRVLAIKFPNAFIGKNQIDNIERKWLGDPQELSGILNWMLTGLHALLCQNDFSKSKTTEETTIEFKRISDTIGAWLQEKTKINPKTYTTRAEAFEHYKTYCDEIEASPEVKTKFTQRLRDTPRIKDGWVRENDKKERAWLCLELLPNDTGTDVTLGTLVRYSTREENKDSREKEVSNSVPSVPSVPVPNGSSVLEANSESVEYKQQNQTAYVSHVKTAEPCYNNCGLASEWQVKIEPDFQQCFCNGCFDKARRDLEKSGFKVEFKEAEQP
jgi:P4 family phage/plasmid primase-like protien